MNDKKYPFVSNPRDPRFLTLQSLQTPHGRSRSGLCIIEGIRHVSRAFEHTTLESIFLEPSALSNRFGKKLARRIRTKGVPGVRLSHQLYRDLTLASDPQGIGAVLRQNWISLNELPAERNAIWIAAESIESAGNLGTIIRTAEAAGANGLFVLGPDCDPFDPATIRASMGSLFSQRLVRCPIREFTEWAKSHRIAIVASSPTGLMDYKALRYRFPAAIVIGSEKRGLSEQLLDCADFIVRIPMQSGCDSLNVAVATGILLFEVASQRRPSP
jgi:RNA methyltransferase, TrmH family